MVWPLPSISPVKSSHLNPRLVNPTQLHFPKPNADGDSSPNMLLPESPHFTCLLANLKFCNPLSFFLITQIEFTRKCCKTHFRNRSRIHSLIFPAHTPDKQQHPHPGPCAVSLRLLCASLPLYLLTLHSSLTDASREQSHQLLFCSNHPITSYPTEIKSTPF